MARVSLSVEPAAPALGAVVRDLDIGSPLAAPERAALAEALDRHAVLVFRGVDLSPRALVDFTRCFGEPERHVISQFALPDEPDVFVVSNLKEDGKPKGAIRAGQYWHSDLSYAATPTLASILHARQVPTVGGDTLFASQSAAYDALSAAMRERLAPLRAVHDYTLAYETFFSRFPDRPPLSEAERAKVPPVEHPVVRTHPGTGRKALFVNPGFTRRIVGFSEDESHALLDFLFTHAVRDEFIYRHCWQPGDLVIWDNRQTVHQALSDYDMNEARHLHRTSVAGDAPF